jgi:hypothetical protein
MKEFIDYLIFNFVVLGTIFTVYNLYIMLGEFL